MKKNFFIGGSMALAFMLNACSTTPANTLAIQKANNQYEVTGIGKTQLISKNNAISAANKTCRSGSSPVISNEHSKYNGVLNEQTGKIADAAAGLLGVLTGNNSSASLSKDTDYETTLSFYCKANP